jgi:hypothetical protein
VYGYSSYKRIKEVLHGYVGNGKTQELCDAYVVEDDGCWIVIIPLIEEDSEENKFMVSMYAPVAAKYMARRFDLFTCYLLYNKYQEVI